MLLRLATLSSVVLLLKTSYNSLIKLHVVYIPDLCFCNPKFPYGKVKEEVYLD